MKRTATLTALLLASLFAITGCANSPYAYNYSVDPHAGQEYQHTMQAVGNVIRPYSQLNPVQTEQRIQGLEGLGVLMDLMSR